MSWARPPDWAEFVGALQTGLSQCLAEAPVEKEEFVFESEGLDDVYQRRKFPELVQCPLPEPDDSDVCGCWLESPMLRNRSLTDDRPKKESRMELASESMSRLPIAVRHPTSCSEQAAAFEEDAESSWAGSEAACSSPELDLARSIDFQQETERWAMLAEDLAAQRLREQEDHLGSQQEGCGRVILRASLTCRDSAGVDSVLEEQQLELRLRQRARDAARHFLEEENQLKAELVQRYLEPLANWLTEEVDTASSFPVGGHRAEGDLNDLAEAERR